MSVNPYSPLLKMTKAPPGFRDPIYEKAIIFRPSAVATKEGTKKAIVAAPISSAPKEVLEVASKLSQLNLK
jgi:hypothetical protein